MLPPEAAVAMVARACEWKMAMDDPSVWLEPERFSGAGQSGRRAFTASPLVVDFHRLLGLKNATGRLIAGVPIQELAHTVTALYDICLPNNGPEDLRSTICAIGTKTIVLVRDEKEVFEEYNRKTLTRPTLDIPGTKSSATTEDIKEENLEDNEHEVQLEAGLKPFLSSVQERRQQRQSGQENGDLPYTAIGMEARIVAALSYVRSVMKSGDRVVQLTLLSTRKRYRGCGVGKYLLQILRDPAVVGKYDAIVTHADSNAVKFFTHCGFSNDVMLNRKFKEFEADWSYTILMSYFPPFSLGKDVFDPCFNVDQKQIELQLELRRDKSLAAYQAQAVCMTRLLHEITALRTQVISQKEQIKALTSDLENACETNLQMEKRLLDYKLKENNELLDISCINTGERPVQWNSAAEEYKQIGQQFIKTMKKESRSKNIQFEVTSVLKANLPKDTQWMIESCMNSMLEPMYRTTMYFCGGLHCAERLQHIIENGFSKEDFNDEIYGQGLYFSPNASTACMFSVPGLILVANVCIGNAETVMTKNRERDNPSKGFDSILVPGRLCDKALSPSSGIAQEYVIFKPLQVLPVCLLIYRSTTSSDLSPVGPHHVSH
uniref:uncharacterized protein n=1 Tax=Pristiophorus japonicus TaxID=55135 RepID=UPI00398EC566